MTRRFAADPNDAAAIKLVKIVGYSNRILIFVSCFAAILASLATLSDVVTVRWLTEYSGLTFFDIVRVVAAGIGMFLFWQAISRLLPEVLFRKHLQKGTILELDASIVRLDLSNCEDPAAVRFSVQQNRNTSLRRYTEGAVSS